MNQPQVAQYPPGHILTVGAHQAKIIKYLTSGGFAQVYTVEISPRNEYTKSNIACLKRVIVPDKIGLNVLRAEVDAMKLLQKNKHIVSYIDSHASKFSTHEGSYEVFMLMEYCEHGGLIDFLNSRLRNRLKEDEILNIMNQTCQGIAAMHRLQPPLIHRDIKIENVLIAADNTFKVCDFGSVCGVIRPPKNSQELMLVQHDIMKNTTAQYRCPEMLHLTHGFPIDEKSDIWALGVFLYKLCYYTTPFEKVGETAILNGKYQYPAFPIYSDRMKNLIRVLLTQHPFQRPNICQVLEEISRMQGIACPIRNFYLERVKESEFLSSQISNFPMSMANMAPVKNVVTPSKQSQQIISPLKPQLSPVRNHAAPLQYSQTMTLPQPVSYIKNQNIPNLGAPHVSKSFANIEPQLQSPTMKPVLPQQDESPSRRNANMSTPQFRNYSNSNSNNYSNNVGGIPSSPTRRPNEGGNSKYINSQTQTDDEVISVKMSRSNSINSTTSSISSRYSIINDNNTGGSSVVRKLSEQLKKVMTNDSTNISPVRTRNDTGNSIKSTIEALRNSISGISNNVRSFSQESFRNASSSSVVYRRTISSESISESDACNERSDRRSKYKGVPRPQLNIQEEDTELSHEPKLEFPERTDKSYLALPEHPTPFQSPSPMKFNVDKDMKDSIQKRVMDLLNAAQKSPVRRTASGYGKYTENLKISPSKYDHSIYEPKVKIKPKVPLRRQVSINVASRQLSVVMKPLMRSMSQSDRQPNSRSSRGTPPSVPSKPKNFRPAPPKKSKRLSMMVIPQDDESVDIDNRKISNGSVIYTRDSNSSEMVDVNIDKLEEDFRRRFPSTVQ